MNHRAVNSIKGMIPRASLLLIANVAVVEQVAVPKQWDNLLWFVRGVRDHEISLVLTALMTPRFASQIDPIFEHVLNLLERAEDGHDPDPLVEQEIIGRRLTDAELFLGETEEWLLAKFAVVSWIDEILVHGCTWKHGDWWHQNLLEGQHFKVDSTDSILQGNGAAREFFDRARQAAGLAEKDALEVFYIAVVLGFRGIYGQKGLNPQAYGLPSTLPKWLKTTSAALQLGLGRTPLPRASRPISGAKALNGRLEFLGALVWFLLFAIIVTMLFFLQS